MIEGDAWRWDQRSKIGLSTAWHTEAYARTKGRLPNLESAFRKIAKKQHATGPQTAEQQMGIMRMFAALAEGAQARKRKRKKGRR